MLVVTAFWQVYLKIMDLKQVFNVSLYWVSFAATTAGFESNEVEV